MTPKGHLAEQETASLLLLYEEKESATDSIQITL